jgi:WD40 repeat protein
MSTPRSRFFLFGPDGNLYVLNGNNTKEIYIYNLSTKNEIGKIHLENQVDYRKPFAFGPDGLLYVHRKTTLTKQIDIYDVTSKKKVDSMNVHRRNAELTFGPDGLLYVNRRGAGNMFVYDTTTKKLVDQFTRNWYSHHIEFDSNGFLYAISTSNGQRLQIWNVATKQLVSWFQLYSRAEHIAIKTTRTGQESLVTINLTLRTKSQYGKDRQFKKKDYHAGNYKLDKTDKYKRDPFSSTVLVRNLAL